ncbi:MAG: ZIP family metal transporter [Caulobacteraceae bacterium]|nr:ZIP family metal transporter [Caulobacter sp.]
MEPTRGGGRLTAHLPPLATVLLLALAASAATCLGGLTALRVRRRARLLSGLASGVVIGVALLDLTAEALKLGAPRLGDMAVLATVLCGFLLFLLLERGAALLSARGAGGGSLGPAGLVGHSLMDGLGIGLAFGASPTLGWMVALAVVAHDMFDGVNTIALCLGAEMTPRRSLGWLAADACAPLAGVALAQFMRVPDAVLATLLALFAGFLLYIGAVELLPQGQDGEPRLSALLAPAVGAAFIFGVLRLARG